MKIVFFSHPLFLGSQSMLRFANMLSDGMKARGHKVEIWRPEPYFLKLKVKGVKKWLGYLDQYLAFPLVVRRRLKQLSAEEEVLYVITDHALGPYVPLINKMPHVIHCHDFLAQRSALGQIAENLTSYTGIKYQQYIRNGYSQGRNFISVSKRTKIDLEEFLEELPDISEVVYNGLDKSFKPLSKVSSRKELQTKLGADLSMGYILHVGGNQWYKNRGGVVAIYDSWRKLSGKELPLLLVGEEPDGSLLKAITNSAYAKDIFIYSGAGNDDVQIAYSGATVFIFPSLAEGFGWPIAEAMASGTLVITTNEAPMTEVAGDAAFLIDRMPFEEVDKENWATKSAGVLETILNLSEEEFDQHQLLNKTNVARFDLEKALDEIEEIYIQVLNQNTSS
ncbi:glycosyltransferase [Pedobacter sp. MC2016-14]|uniref:glycosyltransferase n=1 Tax=Pedobacter sp. MC2016-14 TaxID=2897327 RepID=UPI001E3499BD|nr:glycosyltransferase [Pedobacter sp. MC2016-14]MCD0486859.1 glycosyltransferase [Pedobacter sp. MC2016-14]